MPEAYLEHNADVPCRSIKKSAAILWLHLLGVLLFLYAVLGKGISYVGIGNLYIGEIVICLGIPLVVFWGLTRRLVCDPALVALLLFCFWGLVRTVTQIDQFGLLAIRDAALWGYGIFAVMLVTAIARMEDPAAKVVSFLRIYAPAVVLCAPVVFIGGKVLAAYVPCWPGSTFHLLYHKSGDVLVHLAIVYAAVASGALPWSVRIWAIPWTISAIIVMPFNRGGSLVLVLIGLLSLFPKWANRRWPLAIGSVICGMIFVLALTGLRIEIDDYNERVVSFEQITENAASLVGGETSGNQNANIQWRMRWWQAIIEELPEQGYGWVGVGFGPHIARQFNVLDTPIEARSPHNVWMTIYARMGMVGLVLWSAMLLLWFRTVIRGIRRFEAIGDVRRASLLKAAAIAMPGMLLNASVDIYFEGPVGGIWFWCLFGAAVGLVRGKHFVKSTAGGPPSMP